MRAHSDLGDPRAQRFSPSLSRFIEWQLSRGLSPIAICVQEVSGQGLQPIIRDSHPTVRMDETGLQPIICNTIRMDETGLQPIIRDTIRMDETGLQPIICNGSSNVCMEEVRWLDKVILIKFSPK